MLITAAPASIASRTPLAEAEQVSAIGRQRAR